MRNNSSPLAFLIPRPDGHYDALQLNFFFLALVYIVHELLDLNSKYVGIFVPEPAYYYIAAPLSLLLACFAIWCRPVSYLTASYSNAYVVNKISLNLKKIAWNFLTVLIMAFLLCFGYMPLLIVATTPTTTIAQTKSITLQRQFVKSHSHGRRHFISKLLDHHRYCFDATEFDKAIGPNFNYCTSPQEHAARSDVSTKDFHVTTSWLGTIYQS